MKFKKILRAMLPQKHHVQQHHQMRLFRNLLDDPDIFHLTRRSVAGGTATGLFFAFMPVPGQTLLGVLVALWLRVNLPLAAAVTWISNPLTMPPIFYLAYRLGATILGHPVLPIHIEMSWAWFGGTLMDIWPSLLTGSLILAMSAALIGYVLVMQLWRMAVIQKWEKRKSLRKVCKDKDVIP